MPTNIGVPYAKRLARDASPPDAGAAAAPCGKTMVRPDRDEHAWERLCARKRDEIERDTRLLSAQQLQRCERAERLYAELESAHAHTEDKEEEI